MNTSVVPISYSQSAKVVKKIWGKEIWLANNEKYCGKILCFDKGAECSMHYHYHKHETFYVLKGLFIFKTIDLSNAEKSSKTLTVGQVITIPSGNPHKLIAVEDDSQIIEISTQHFDEDSLRIEPGTSS